MYASVRSCILKSQYQSIAICYMYTICGLWWFDIVRLTVTAPHLPQVHSGMTQYRFKLLPLSSSDKAILASCS